MSIYQLRSIKLKICIAKLKGYFVRINYQTIEHFKSVKLISAALLLFSAFSAMRTRATILPINGKSK